jgi:hypothetical protein
MISFLTSHWVDISAALSGIVVAARIIVKFTPTPADDSVLESVVTFLKHVGLTSDTISK